MLLLEDRSAAAEFVTRFQQTTPAIMAKGVEDTAFYRYGRLLALNDVGGDPSPLRALRRAAFTPATSSGRSASRENLLTTQTHDAKRSADVRARIATLASMPAEWAAQVRALVRADRAAAHAAARPTTSSATSSSRRWSAPGRSRPSGSRPTCEKALREAKRNTNWIEQNAEWEDAVKRFCARALADAAVPGRLRAVRRPSRAGR